MKWSSNNEIDYEKKICHVKKKKRNKVICKLGYILHLWQWVNLCLK